MQWVCVDMSEAPIICDNGTGYVKVGFAPSNFPLYNFPSMLGRPLLRFEEKVSDMEIKELMIGDECAANRAMLEVTYPVENGQVSISSFYLSRSLSACMYAPLPLVHCFCLSRALLPNRLLCCYVHHHPGSQLG
jgi:hypothetical protein